MNPCYSQPELETERLILRPFKLSDAARVQQLAGIKAVAEMTDVIPHPYPDGLAETWIGTHQSSFKKQREITYAITLKTELTLIGCIGIINLNTQRPAIGYWVGQDYWKNGYCTEACCTVLDYLKRTFEPDSVFSEHLSCNPASGRVLEKSGFKQIAVKSGKSSLSTEPEEIKVYQLDFNVTQT